MAEQDTFARIPYYVIIGQCVVSNNYCLYIGSAGVPDDKVLRPPHGRKHVVHTVYRFSAPKKVPYNLIITTLKAVGIFPNGDAARFAPPVNPDGRYYTDIPEGALGKLKEILVVLISAMTINTQMLSVYEEIPTSAKEIRAIRERERPQLTLSSPSVVILGTNKRGNSDYAVLTSPSPQKTTNRFDSLS